MPIGINEFNIPTDFVVLNYGLEPKNPLILGRTFLATTGTIIDIRKGRICLNIRDLPMHFDMEKLVKKPLIDGQSFFVDHLSKLADEYFKDMCFNDPLESALIAPEADIFSINDQAAEYARLMDASEEVIHIDVKEEIKISHSVDRCSRSSDQHSHTSSN